MSVVAGIASAVAALASARQQRHAGQIARGEAEVAAKAEEVAAVQREADRKSRLADALASQNASFAASNVAAFEGSPLAVMREDIRREELATQRDKFQTQLGAMTKRARGLITERQAKTGSNIGLIRFAAQRATAASG